MSIAKTDRIGELLREHLNVMVFDELSYDYLKRAEVYDILKDIPVPIRKTEMTGISVLKIAMNMAFVFGVDPDFKYKDNYIKYILKNFDKNFANGMIAQGVDTAQGDKYDEACIWFRAAIQIDPDNAKAYYCYGRALKDCYEKIAQAEETSELVKSDPSVVEDIIGRYKAESIEAFEIATIKDENLTEAYYFLGYAYLNMGLYMKAKLIWQKYLKLAERDSRSHLTGEKDKALEDAIKDIRQRMTQLEEPVKIEEGYNLILSGKFEEGIKALRPYTEEEGRFREWWPLWYYLGTAYRELAKQSEKELLEAESNADAKNDEVVRAAYEEALKYYLQVLKLSPSNRDAMGEVVEIYKFLGNEEKVDKYTKKLAIITENAEADREMMRNKAQLDAGITRPVKMS